MAWRSSRAALAATFLVLAAGQAEARPPGRPADPPAADADRLRPVAIPAAAPVRMIGVMPLADNLEFGIGRYSVGEIARPRTHMEADRHPTDVRRRGRGIAGIGLKLSF